MPQKTTSQTHGAIAAFICALCYLIGIIFIAFLAPEFNDIPTGRLKAIDTFGWLLNIWYIIVYPVVGVCIVLLSKTLTYQTKSPANILTLIITLTSYLAASYLMAICCIEIMSNEFYLAQRHGNEHDRYLITNQIYSVLMSLRQYTEWTVDLWILLISYHLFRENRFNRLFVASGFVIGALGFLILFNQFTYLVYFYLVAIILWFSSIGVLLMHYSRKQFATAK